MALQGIQTPRPNSARVGKPLDKACSRGIEAKSGDDVDCFIGCGEAAFAGAKTSDSLPFKRRLDKIAQQLEFSLPEFAKYGVQSLLATDDGSAGFAGLVTDCLLEWLGKSDLAGESTVIYSCGPEVMLARMAEIAKERNIDCQVSMERRMACGIGICQSCAIECKTDGPGESVYKMCCTDGPVFDSKEIVFHS